MQTPLVLALLGVAWLTAGGMAVRTVSRIWLRHWAERRLHGGGAATIYLERPQRLLAAAGTGVAAILLAAGIFLGARVPAPTLLGRLLVFGLLVIGFGQIFARELARRWPTVLAPFVLPVLGAVEVVSRPLSEFGRLIAAAATMAGDIKSVRPVGLPWRPMKLRLLEDALISRP